MNVFDVREHVVGRYARYMKSFVRIADPAIDQFVQHKLDAGRLWPEPLIQLNPSFKSGGQIDDLVREGVLDQRSRDIFRVGRSEERPDGSAMRLHVHQREALQAAQEGASYVLTTGTGSGKSLAYFVPIIDRVLKDGPGKGIKAIVVYPMNALANSQIEELEKFLGKDASTRAVSFARYTGQDSSEERDAILNHPPDILLTNYVMLELILTRSHDSIIIDSHAQNMQFLVLDELHTYRGRQGADVAMLVRRVRERIRNPYVQCVGTSATMSSKPSKSERQEEIADVASLLFGSPVKPHHVIGETLEWTTTGIVPANDELIASVHSVMRGQVPQDSPEFRDHPLARWVEHRFGLQLEGVDLVRQRPITVAEGGQALSQITDLDVDDCITAIQNILLRGYDLEDEQTKRRLFAFRLHQFISRGDAVYSTLESDVQNRHLSMEAQVFVEDDTHGRRNLYPMAFCRECGQEFFPVHWQGSSPDAGELVPREVRDRAAKEDETRRSGYLWFDRDRSFRHDDEHLPEDWLEERNGVLRVKSSYRKQLPVPVDVELDGRVRTFEGESSAAWFFHAPLAFCPGCGHVWAGLRTDFPKLAELSTEGRATATTILSLATVQALHASDALSDSARKLLSFTDNRQDASLQAGHFNDFIRTSLLRGAILAALQSASDECLDAGDIASAVFRAMDLPFEDYALNSDVSERRRSRPQEVMQRILGYHVFLDLRRGWRVNSPNLEQVGLLRVEYDGLDELCADESLWRDTHERLRDADPAIRRKLCLGVLEFFRRELAIHTEYLDKPQVERMVRDANAFISPTSDWTFEEDRDSQSATSVAVRAKSFGQFSEHRALTPRSRFGQMLNRPRTWGDAWSGPLKTDDRLVILQDLCRVLEKDALLVSSPGETKGEPLYQLQAGYMRWTLGDGTPQVDLTAAKRQSHAEAKPNRFFDEFYRQVAASLADPNDTTQLRRYNAREHTAQVPSAIREEREAKFREASISVLYCSPTMELGVDISDLNAVNMRNVPPTPANYAQRSGRAGRSGQPALVVTYCTSGSPHDQYYFRNREKMVAGVVTPPRIDLGNEDLVASHLRAVWLAETGQSLGKTLSDVLDLEQQDLPLKPVVTDSFTKSAVLKLSLQRARHLMEMIEPHLGNPAWLVDGWVENLLKQAPTVFDRSCDRWRTLYRAAVSQLNENNDRRQSPLHTHHEQREAARLWGEAGRQLDLLKDEGKVNSDFYSYRYFASEGFLPGYNFPRLPLTAYLPTGKNASGRNQSGDDYVSRGRFVAISEFGPGNHIYYEGNRYVIDRVILPAREDGALLREGKFCQKCGYGHMQPLSSIELCENCGEQLGGGDDSILLDNLFRMENVTTRLVDRITSDEEERQRMGYELKTSFRFKVTEQGTDYQRAVLSRDGEALAELTYAPAATIWRLNFGWRRRKDRSQRGFMMDLQKGRWSKKEIEEQQDLDARIVDQVGASDPEANRRVVPFVEDTRNVLVLRPERTLEPDELITLGFALKRGIETIYQLESNELALEFLPGDAEPRSLFFFESSEGGAGVLTRLVRDPEALAAVVREALSISHLDPDNLHDLARLDADHEDRRDSCVAACYDCLLSYSNQRYHRSIDRRLLPAIMDDWREATTALGSGSTPREELRDQLLLRSDSELERDFIRFLDVHGYALPDRAQPLLEDYGTRPDFLYEDHLVAVYVDGPHHLYPERKARDIELTTLLERNGIQVMRVTDRARWPEEVAAWTHVLGAGTREKTTW